jgi:DNA invertase Pin-like site-specific DNA recombinase
MKQLKFACLVRVSTEKQERRGESLSTQRKQLEAAVKALNGTVYKWYAGQEHSTPDHERKILDELMADAQANKFDCVMAVDASRWSRDNQKSKTHLAALKKNGIQFYLLTKHMDLNEPFNNLILGMGVEINEYFAAEQASKSLLNKIELAKKGIPSSGQIPYGRTFDKEKKVWGIDEEKKKIIQDCARRYLKGEGIQDIASYYRMNICNLHKLLKKTSGDTFDIHFCSERFGINEIVSIPVPRLLPQAIIEKMKRRSKSNLTFTHSQPKHKYLLGRMIFCEQCGMSLFGQANHNDLLYYRHSRTDHCKKPHAYLAAPLIEADVLRDIMRMFGDRPAMEKAAKSAIPNMKEVEELSLAISQGEKELAKVDHGIEKILDMIEADNITGAEVKKRMTKLQGLKTHILSELDSSKTKLASIPSKAAIVEKSVFTMQIIKKVLRSEKHLARMSFNDKRKLLQAVFDGKDTDGKRLGIYIGRNKKGAWIYTIRGIMGLSLTDFVRKLEPTSPQDWMASEDYNEVEVEEEDKQHLRCKNDTNAAFNFSLFDCRLD